MVTNIHKKIHDRIVTEWGVPSKMYFIDKLQKINKKLINDRDEQTMKLIEQLYKKSGNRRVVLLCHSMGCKTGHYLLNFQRQI